MIQLVEEQDRALQFEALIGSRHPLGKNVSMADLEHCEMQTWRKLNHQVDMQCRSFFAYVEVWQQLHCGIGGISSVYDII